MKTRKTGWAIAALVTFATVLAVAADDSSTGKIDKPPSKLSSVADPYEKDPLIIDIPCENITDASTQAACWRALTQRFDYFSTGMDHRARVFAWQHLSSRIIFVFVLILVSAGLAFSYMQFRVYLIGMRRPAAKTESPPDRKLDTDLEISSGGVKVSSNVLGVIILALSLAFFYLYLVYVFPISDTF